MRPTAAEIAGLLRELAPQVVGALVRRYGHFDMAEDAAQEALLAAATQWPAEGMPRHPKGWLLTVASRRLTDALRADAARRAREESVAVQAPADSWIAPPPDADEPAVARDDTLTLLFLCCHPALTPASQVALTLRAVGGLTTAEVARSFLVPEATMAQRSSRAKAAVRKAGARFELPAAGERAARVAAVERVLYLMFDEGYAATDGTRVVREALCAEAIRLARLLHRLLPDDPSATGLLALLLLTDARRPARTGPDGALVPLAEQDRSRWDGAAIAEGSALVTQALSGGTPTSYAVQAAIAALHDEAPSADATDWPQILALYGVLERLDPSPVVTLNRAVALAMVDGPAAGLALVDGLAGDPRLGEQHRLDAVRAHLLELAGDPAAAAEAYAAAARRARNEAEQRYLRQRAERLTHGQ